MKIARAGRGERVDAADPFALSPCLLRFAAATQVLFERETGAERSRHLRRSILVGLLFYNAYDLSDLLLIADVAPLSIALRVLLITPVALLLAWKTPALGPRLREAVVTVAMIAVMIVPILALALSRSPYAGYTLAEIPLVLVFGGMMLVLETGYATLFLAVTALLAGAAAYRQPLFSGPIVMAILLQIVTACAFVSYGNRRIELVRRRSYLMTLRERQRSEGLESIRRELATLSATDPLTGIANRRALDQLLSQHEEARRSIGIVMIDIDHFKSFNDAYGHSAGDACIQAVAEALACSVRAGEDVAARFGGEEFAVVIAEPDAAVLSAAMDRMRRAVRDLAIRHDARPDGVRHVTISTGAAALRMQHGAARLLIDLADNALYEAKRAGRDAQRLAASAGKPLAA